MNEYELGPNGGILYCIEFLESNIDWLLEGLKKNADKYLIFDCPGQVELFTNHQSMRSIIRKIEKCNIRICVVNLVESHYCHDPSRYISMLMVSLRTMLHLEAPHINILSKIDLIEEYGRLEWSLDYYMNAHDLSKLIESLNKDSFGMKYKRLNSAICEMIDEFGLVSFLALAIEDKESVWSVISAIDKAIGYVPKESESNGSTFDQVGRLSAWGRYNQEVAEKYLKNEYDDDTGMVKDIRVDPME